MGHLNRRTHQRHGLPLGMPVELRRRGFEGAPLTLTGKAVDLSITGMAVLLEDAGVELVELFGLWLATFSLPDGDGGTTRLDIDCRVVRCQRHPVGLVCGLNFYNMLDPGQGELRRLLRRFLLGSLWRPMGGPRSPERLP